MSFRWSKQKLAASLGRSGPSLKDMSSAWYNTEVSKNELRPRPPIKNERSSTKRDRELVPFALSRLTGNPERVPIGDDIAHVGPLLVHLDPLQQGPLEPAPVPVTAGAVVGVVVPEAIALLGGFGRVQLVAAAQEDDVADVAGRRAIQIDGATLRRSGCVREMRGAVFYLERNTPGTGPPASRTSRISPRRPRSR